MGKRANLADFELGELERGLVAARIGKSLLQLFFRAGVPPEEVESDLENEGFVKELLRLHRERKEGKKTSGR